MQIILPAMKKNSSALWDTTKKKIFTFLNLNNSLKIVCRACNLTSFSPCLTGPVDYLFASCHKGPRFKSPRGLK